MISYLDDTVRSGTATRTERVSRVSDLLKLGTWSHECRVSVAFMTFESLAVIKGRFRSIIRINHDGLL